ncbi:MAG: thioredoxin family protein [Candidatus Pedobacter colombiensis]|uniref:Thioredoxin family protein n=1 Tax=Candidatus Pedobacter colombiensis TaxID=3121371 RepID=A0AAJ5W8G4_9SPHI|nr:thioredoxin family protein [Pedobacter sp.]WEK20573.1 MAG: thioredoxin family protein [Pedobacter sp.]
MKSIFTFLFLFAAISLHAQEEIHFNSSWSEAKEKAIQSKKLIFIDCYTLWCAPCKWMEKNVFIQPAVYQYYNDNFVNLKVDMEKGEGIEMRKKYNVQSFPTYLFVNTAGDVVHRTASKMEAEAFLAEAKRAVDPKRNAAALKEKYDRGDRDLPFLLDYYLAVERADRNIANQISTEIVAKVTEAELNTELGWKIIKTLARAENDKLGAHFMANQGAYNNWGKQEEREQLKDRLITSTMYGLMRSDNEQAFMKKLTYFKNSDRINRKKQGIMLEADFYLEKGRTADYVKLTAAALKNELKDDAEKLSFLARRASGGKMGNDQTSPAILQQAYLMAKRAVELEPEEYSIQSTFAYVCLAMKKKQEALVAAKKSRELANAETSKIQKLAQELLDKVEAL